MVAQRVYYEVLDEGEGAVLDPLEYPVKRNGSFFHFFIIFSQVSSLNFLQTSSSLCGTVRIRVQIFGYGTTYNIPIAISPGDMNVVSWENGQEELYDAVKEHVVESPNSFLKSAFLFSTLKTTTQVFFFFLFFLLFLFSF